MVHLIGYRRFGHNEADEPAYTQPLMYLKIRQHPTVRELFAAQLVAEGLIRPEEVDALAKAMYGRVADAHKRVKEHLAAELDDLTHEQVIEEPDDPMLRTAVSHRIAHRAQRAAAHLPEALHAEHQAAPSDGAAPHRDPRGRHRLGHRRGARVRITDHPGSSRSGSPARTRCAARSATVTSRFTTSATARCSSRCSTSPTRRRPSRCSTARSARSARLGFEYGYSAADPETLVIWEAQYGDFFNNAQMIVDQFVSSARAKWGQHSRLTMLLPHGYEGSGPEHSSARIERFLQLCANDNMRLANCTTPSQYFHLLRSQGLLSDPRPLVVFTPKSLLRLKESTSTLDRPHHRALPAGDRRSHRAATSRRGAHAAALLRPDLLRAEPRRRKRADATDVAIARVELLYPLPVDAILDLVASYPNLERLCWVQEEPQNMGAWGSLERAIGLARPSQHPVGVHRQAAPRKPLGGLRGIAPARGGAHRQRGVRDVAARSQGGSAADALPTRHRYAP